MGDLYFSNNFRVLITVNYKGDILYFTMKKPNEIPYEEINEMIKERDKLRKRKESFKLKKMIKHYFPDLKKQTKKIQKQMIKIVRDLKK